MEDEDGIFWQDNWNTVVAVDHDTLKKSLSPLGIQPGYDEFVRYFKERQQVIRFLHFSPFFREKSGDDQKSEDEHDDLRRVVDRLVYNGFMVIRKDVFPYEDREGNPRYPRYSTSLDIACELFDLVDSGNVDHVILIAGDRELTIPCHRR